MTGTCTLAETTVCFQRKHLTVVQSTPLALELQWSPIHLVRLKTLHQWCCVVYAAKIAALVRAWLRMIQLCRTFWWTLRKLLDRFRLKNTIKPCTWIMRDVKWFWEMDCTSWQSFSPFQYANTMNEQGKIDYSGPKYQVQQVIWLAVYDWCICTLFLRSNPGLPQLVIKSRTSQDLCSDNRGIAVEASLHTAVQWDLRMSAQLVLFNEVVYQKRHWIESCFFYLFCIWGFWLLPRDLSSSFDTIRPCVCKPNWSGIWAIKKLFRLANFAKAIFIPCNVQYMAHSAFNFKQACRSLIAYCAPYRSLSANFYSIRLICATGRCSRCFTCEQSRSCLLV